MRLGAEMIVRSITRKLNSLKKVSKGIEEDDVKKLLSTIDAINSLGEDETEFQNRLLDKWEVPSSLRVLFYPEAVKADITTKLASDVLDREDLKDSLNDAVNYDEFTNICSRIAGLFKKDASFDTSISSMREKVSLLDAVKRQNHIGHVHWNGDDYFLPLKLRGVELGYKDAYFNADVQDVLDELILHSGSIFSM